MTMFPNKVLPLQSYQTRNVIKKAPKSMDVCLEYLKEGAPEFFNDVVDGYTIIGKTAKFQQYVGEKDGETYFLILKRKTNQQQKVSGVAPNKVKDISDMNLTTKKLGNINVSPDLFIPMKSGTALDYCFSAEGGIMPATNYIVIGDPGIGKSSISIEYVARILNEYKDKKVLFISGEMGIYDLIPYTQRFPLWNEVDILFTSELTEGLYKESIETKLTEGYDLILMDSIAEIVSSVSGDYNEVVSAKE